MPYFEGWNQLQPFFVLNIGNKEGGGGGSEEFLITTVELGFRAGDAFAEGKQAAFGVDGTGFDSYGPVVGGFELQRDVGLAGSEAGVNGATAGGVEQRGDIAAMGGADEVVKTLVRRGFEYNKPFLRMSEPHVERGRDAGLGVERHEVLQVLEARASGIEEKRPWGSLLISFWTLCVGER